MSGCLADDLDGVLVGADGAVGTQPEEHRLVGATHGGAERGIEGKAGTGHVLVDADDKVLLRFGQFQVFEDSLGHGRGELLGTQAVTAADDDRIAVKAADAVGHRFADGGADIQVERLAQRPGLLGAVEHGDAFNGGRKRRNKCFEREGAVEVDLDYADLLTTLDERIDGVLNRVGSGTHDDDNTFGVGCTGVFDQMIGTAGDFGKLVHLFLDDRDAGGIEAVDRFPPLEVDVRVLGGAAHDRTIRGEAPQAVGVDQIVAYHGAHVVEGQLLDLLNLVGGAEAVEEVHERNAGTQSGRLGDQGEVHDLLDIVGAEHGPAGGAAGHDVGMVAEYRERLCRDGSGRDVEDGGGQLAGDLVHVGDHQQQSLAAGEGRGQRAGLQRTMDGSGGATLGLQFGHQRHGAPDVLFTGGALDVGYFPHDGGGGDRVDGDDFVGGVGDVRGGGVAVDGYHFSGHAMGLSCG